MIKKQITFFILFLVFSSNIIAKDKNKNDEIDSNSKYKTLKKTSAAIALTGIGLEIALLTNKFYINESMPNNIYNEIEVTSETAKDIINASIETKESIVIEIIKKSLYIYRENKEKNEYKLPQEIKAQALELLLQRMSNYVISTSINKRIFRRILRTLTNSAISLLPEKNTENKSIAIEKFLINFVYYSIVETIGEMIIREIEAAKKRTSNI